MNNQEELPQILADVAASIPLLRQYSPTTNQIKRLLDVGILAGKLLVKLDRIPHGVSIEERAKISFLKGQIYDSISEHDEEAEYHLQTAVELDPTYEERWLALSTIIAKRGPSTKVLRCLRRGIANLPDSQPIKVQIEHWEQRVIHDYKTGVLGQPFQCFCEVVTEAVPARTLANYDRYFYGCGTYRLRRVNECNFFIWRDQVWGAY